MTTIPLTLPDTLTDERTTRFDAFVAAHRDRAYRMAWRLMDGDASAAEDVVQDALLRAHRGLARFRGEAAMTTWFYRILVRQAANHRRASGTRRGWLAGWLNEAATEPRDQSASVGDPGLRDEIRTALDQLTRPQREVFVLVHLEQFTVAEAAAVMDVATGTAKSHLHRALVALRSHLASHRDPQ